MNEDLKIRTVFGDSVETIGPFNDGDFYKLAVDGYEVPYLRAHLRPGTENIWDIFLDGRLAYELTDEELHHTLPLIANAMAVAAGYTCHGDNCRPRNLFKVRMIGINTVETE